MTLKSGSAAEEKQREHLFYETLTEILFFSLLALMPMIWAVLTCTALYVLIHIFDSKPEIIGAVPFGIILCLLTFYTQSIWVPFIIHCALSCVYEISIYNCLTNNKSKL